MDSLENYGAWSWTKIQWFSCGNFHAFHASMEQENCKNIPHESMESMESETMENHGKHGNLQNESMGSMVFSSILLLIISRKHGKKALKAWESMGFMQMNLYPSGSLVAAGFPGLYLCPGNLADPQALEDSPPYCQLPVALPS